VPLTDLTTRFAGEYKGDIKDPILTTLLQTLDAYQKDVQTQLLLSVYAQRSDQISDGLFEVLRRHLFGQMFPGPAYVVAQADLRDVASAAPVLLEQHHYLSLLDQEGNKILFAPQHPCWIVPTHSNEVRVESFGDDLLLGLKMPIENLPESADATVNIFTGDVDPLLVERLRCRLPQPVDSIQDQRTQRTILRHKYPGVYIIIDKFFSTPYEQRFLRVSFDLLRNVGYRPGDEEIVWLPFQGLGEYGIELERKLTLNAFVAWNLVESEMLAIQSDMFRYRVPITNQATQETIVLSIEDLGTDPPTEYVDAATVVDPGYPFQYTTSANVRRGEVVVALSPLPAGDVKVRYHQYDIGELCLNIAAGRSFGLYQGIDERIKSVHSLTATHRLDGLNDKEGIWNYFRSLLASRNRWVTRDDLRAGVVSFPPFSSRRNIVVKDKIKFEERVGRTSKGFLTPLTEITVPLRDRSLLRDPDRTCFEHGLSKYLSGRTVNGNFLRVKLVSAEDV
jgi:hypothetical protein